MLNGQESGARETDPVGTLHRAAGVWSVTLWTAGRTPSLVALERGCVRLSLAGRLVRRVWQELPTVWPGVVPDEIVVLPDRVRGILHVSPAGADSTVDPIIAWLKAKVAAEMARLPSSWRPLFEPAFEGHLLAGPDELALWRRRIRAAAGALYGASPPSMDRRGRALRER